MFEIFADPVKMAQQTEVIVNNYGFGFRVWINDNYEPIKTLEKLQNL